MKINAHKPSAGKPASKKDFVKQGWQKIRAACSTEKARHIQIVVAILLFCAVIAGIVYGAVKLYQSVFITNPRLQLRRVEVCNLNGSGYWSQHQEELIQKLELKTGMNFHDIHPDQIRKKLLEIPNVAAASVEILHPDTIRLNVAERIPVARLDGSWVVDGKGFILHRSETIADQLPLPVIKELRREGYHPIYRKHTPRQELLPAIRLTAAMQHYPNVQMSQLVIRSDRKLIARVNYMGEECSITFPDDSTEEDYRYLIERFLDALVQARQQGILKKNFDMSFEKRIIVR